MGCADDYSTEAAAGNNPPSAMAAAAVVPAIIAVLTTYEAVSHPQAAAVPVSECRQELPETLIAGLCSAPACLKKPLEEVSLKTII